ncbi:SAM-dependent methyltransferase [Microbacterium hominis]|uniref:SAM-dependent methyltransferase n=1 Tax=Microbacterium TaxID=33882 RepID=UPI00168BBE11|nr:MULTISPECIES: SAM-dependent methyltransferase [Microbacterium]QOC25583.1 SAM-dependent methyltransferase [Microbacterium hominis]QOC29585.1 SAM-dependent methyltransferase [Microbacterium hominis]QYF98043.1 SAM-dependent methyltransferase [Microbacterium sp. PAMC21962]
MPWPFLYFPGDRLSRTELSAARLDGHVVEVGEAYMPADAVETRELRAGSARPWLSAALALTHESAAWVHGALAEPPVRQRVQRVTARRIPSVLDVRLVYRDVALRPEDVEVISGAAVTTPEKTLGDLVRDLCGGIDTQGAVDALVAWRPGLARSTADAVAEGPPLHHKRAAIVYLRARAQEVRAQEEVTR